VRLASDYAWSSKAVKTEKLTVKNLPFGSTTGFVLGLAWCSSVTSGTTKSRATNAILLVGYCGGNLAAPQMWLEKYAPRNTIVRP
jgi:hypothetical protein